MSTLKVSTISPLGTDATKTITIGSAGDTAAGIFTNTPAFLASLSSSQTVSDATETLVQFDTSEYDTDSAFSTSNYRFTVPSGKSGKYMIYYSVNVAGINGGYTAGNYVRSEVYIKKNGDTIHVHKIDPRNSGGFKFTISNSISQNLNVSDYIEIYFWGDVSAGQPLLEVSSNQQMFFGAYKLIGA